MNNIQLTDEQKIVTDGIIKWFTDEQHQYLTVGGYAGTGKSFVLSHLPQLLPDTLRIAFCAFTGKASSVLLQKLRETGKQIPDVSTIHKLIYKPVIDSKTNEIIDWEKNEDLPYDLIIIDEASMVNRTLFEDLIDYDLPILAVGDHGQLSPVSNDDFSLMAHPNLSLETVHRQAKDSPIIKLSMYIRENGKLPRNFDSDYIRELTWWKKNDRSFIDKIPYHNKNIITLSALNKTRVYLNDYFRCLLGKEGSVHDGDRIVCLKNNDHAGIMNGMTGTIESIANTSRQSVKRMMINFDMSSVKKCFSNINTFGVADTKELGLIGNNREEREWAKRIGCNQVDMFDYGYCLTVNKSQGSSWNTVVVVNERSYYTSDLEFKRWLYTAVTRAEERLFIINGY